MTFTVNLARVETAKSPDALHLARAVDCGDRAFGTGDASLARCMDIPVALAAGQKAPSG
jgi:hypothetical protein